MKEKNSCCAVNMELWFAPTRGGPKRARCLTLPSLCTVMSQSWRSQSVWGPSWSEAEHNRTRMAFELCNLIQRSTVTLLALGNLSDMAFLSNSCNHPPAPSHTNTHSLCFLLIYKVESFLCRSHSIKYAVQCCHVKYSCSLKCTRPKCDANRKRVDHLVNTKYLLWWFIKNTLFTLGCRWCRFSCEILPSHFLQVKMHNGEEILEIFLCAASHFTLYLSQCGSSKLEETVGSFQWEHIKVCAQ